MTTAFSFAAAQGTVTLEMDLNPAVSYYRNDSLVVTCTATNENEDRFFLKWLRNVHGTEVQIGATSGVEDAFSLTKRYEANYETPNPGHTNLVYFRLHIKSEYWRLCTDERSILDEGFLSLVIIYHYFPQMSQQQIMATSPALFPISMCLWQNLLWSIVSRKMGERFRDNFLWNWFVLFGFLQKYIKWWFLFITAPVTSVKMISTDSNGSRVTAYSNGKHHEFKEDEVLKLKCLVSGSYPEPEVKVMVGSKDLTTLFTRESILQRVGQTPGLQELYYDVVLRNDHMTIDYEFDNQMLECIATVPNTEYPSVSLGINVTLTGCECCLLCLSQYRQLKILLKAKRLRILLFSDKPKFLCSDTVEAELRETDVNISCLVRADPPLTDFNFFWHHMSAGNTTLKANERSGHYYGETLPGVNTTTAFIEESYFVDFILFPLSIFFFLFSFDDNFGRTSELCLTFNAPI